MSSESLWHSWRSVNPCSLWCGHCWFHSTQLNAIEHHHESWSSISPDLLRFTTEIQTNNCYRIYPEIQRFYYDIRTVAWSWHVFPHWKPSASNWPGWRTSFWVCISGFGENAKSKYWNHIETQTLQQLHVCVSGVFPASFYVPPVSPHNTPPLPWGVLKPPNAPKNSWNCTFSSSTSGVSCFNVCLCSCPRWRWHDELTEKLSLLPQGFHRNTLFLCLFGLLISNKNCTKSKVKQLRKVVYLVLSASTSACNLHRNGRTRHKQTCNKSRMWRRYESRPNRMYVYIIFRYTVRCMYLYT